MDSKKKALWSQMTDAELHSLRNQAIEDDFEDLLADCDEELDRRLTAWEAAA